MRLRPMLIPLVLVTLLLAGCSEEDRPSAADLAAEGKVQTKDAAQKTKEVAEDAAERGKQVADDVADGPDDDGTHRLEIVEPADKAAVKGSSVDLKVTLEGLTIVAADGDTSGKSGHFHVFVDRAPMAVGEEIPKTADIVHSAVNPIKVTGLSPGQHTLTVVLGDGAHRRILANVQDQVTVNVTA